MNLAHKLLRLAGIAALLALAGSAWAQSVGDPLDDCKGFIVDEECLNEKALVKQIQTAFNDSGCDVGPVDGVMGRRTRGWLKVHDDIWKDVGYEQLFEDKRGDDIMTRVSLMANLVCSRAYQMSDECKDAYAKWKTTRGAGAFAVSGLGGCASASGYGSVSSAKSAVLARCSRHGTSCKVHDTKAARRSSGNNRSSGSGSGGCNPKSSKFRRYESSKALVRGSKGCYVAYGASSPGKARTRAMAYCRRKGSTGCKVVHSQ